MTNFRITDPKAFDEEPVANIWLRKDGSGNVDIVINGQTVAFFNRDGELWLVNFEREGVEYLEQAGIKFEPSKEEEFSEEYFTLKIV